MSKVSVSQLKSRKLSNYKGKRRASGSGYIVVTDEVDRDGYVRSCLMRGEVAIVLNDGGLIENVPVSKHIFNYLEFPLDASALGSKVSWVSESQSNAVRIVGIYNKDDESDNNRENVSSIYRMGENSFLEVSVNQKENSVNITAINTNEEGSSVNINANSNSENSRININTTGKVKVQSVGSIELNSQEELFFIIDDNDEENVSKLRIKKGEGLEYIDQFENTISVKEDAITINGKKSVIIGEGSQPIVLGDELKSTLESLIDAITQITVPTGLGPSGVPINSPQFTQIKSSLDSILSEYASTD